MESDLSLRTTRLEWEVSELRRLVAELRSELGRTKQAADQRSTIPASMGGGGRVAKSPAGGIPAMAGDVPGTVGGCSIYDHDTSANTLSLADDDATIFNIAGAVAADIYVLVQQVQGSYWVVVEPCAG